ncbi:uncharacterized protein At1g01500-like [Punica granatum]|uniref:Erythronate-4-phosphate dehydrogenase family protein n=2 Tax=Punica granatum TaxID=22663 RepID=A0A218WS65_PUNGR|nr:uncharacterized protein At1g01500-like [Punica granatum]XP_031404541.1 uncharacterized protein At1g01500-like [Punica granatum]XP_031404542.1 uncharacterized protein At1g01500-like [Punica granatum]OWM75071.1 hypothetical protein CDL15_Pgr021422 [Punica granatum]PKI45157.1 hypothetical protein CRG98_034461 [Punica granatum]
MEEVANRSLDIIRYSSHYQPLARSSLSWFDVRVFYVRISNLQVDDSTPEWLTVNHIPLDPDTLLEVNGSRSGIYSDGVGFHLRRDRADKKSEEATFVSTDNIRLTGSVKFEVLEREDLILSGVLEVCNTNGFVGDSKDNVKRKWSMICEPGKSSDSGFSKKTESLPINIEVYIAGCFSGSPVILTKTLQISSRRKHTQRRLLDAIPETETECLDKDESSGLGLQVTEYQSKTEDEEDYNYNYNDMYWRRMEYMDGEDGELSWFNAGVRVGVGIGLGICVGIGVGVGLLVRTYRVTTRNFSRRLV